MKRKSILGLTLVFTSALGLFAGCTGAKAVNHGASASRSCTGSDWIPSGVVRDDPLGKVAIFNIATAISDSGAAVVTWYETALPLQTGNSEQLFASVCNAGSWTAPVPLGSTNTIQSVLAARADGTAMAAWAEVAADSSTSIWVSTLDPAQATWGPPVRVTAPDAQGMPSAIAMGDDGTAMIVWDQKPSVWADRFNGSAWEAPVVISAGPTSDAVGIVASPDGKAYMALWEEDSPSMSSIWARRYSNGAWETPTMLDHGDVRMGLGRPGAPRGSLAMDAFGSAAAGWLHQSRYLYGAMYSTAAKQWTPSYQIADRSNSLVLALDAQGRAVATWDSDVDSDGGTATVEHAGWGDPQSGVWQTTDTLQSSDLRAGSDSKGHTWAAWSTGSWETNDATLWAASYDPPTGLTSKRALWTASGIENPYGLSLRVSPSGRALLAMITYGVSPTFHYKLVALTYTPN